MNSSFRYCDSEPVSNRKPSMVKRTAAFCDGSISAAAIDQHRGATLDGVFGSKDASWNFHSAPVPNKEALLASNVICSTGALAAVIEPFDLKGRRSRRDLQSITQKFPVLLESRGAGRFQLVYLPLRRRDNGQAHLPCQEWVHRFSHNAGVAV